MSVLYIALPAAILLGAAGLMGCLYCIRSGQYDDLESSALRILIEDHAEEKATSDKDRPATEKLEESE
jgi:cbb3-type cytochrome oxidase maturation protein